MHRLGQLFRSHIRFKIILPYVFLTIVVMLAGAFIALALAAATVQDRFSNEVTRVARATNDAIFKREQGNLNFLWQMAYAQANDATGARAVPDAFASGTSDELALALEPFYVQGARQPDLELDRLVAFDLQGIARVDWQKALDDNGQPISPDPMMGRIARPGTDFSRTPGVQNIIAGQRDAISDKYSGLFRFENNLYFYTAVPVRNGEGEDAPLVGGLLIAQRLDHMLATVEASASRADITVLYDNEGAALLSTVNPLGVAGSTLPDLDMSQATLTRLRTTPAARTPSLLDRLGVTPAAADEPGWSVQDLASFNGREYQQAFAPLIIRRVQVGYISAGLARDFLISAWAANRNAIIAITIGLVGGAVLIGLLVARQISTPLQELVATAQAVTSGDLQRRSSVTSQDELGVLARTFNQMTDHLLGLYTSSRDLSSMIDVQQVLRTAQQSAEGFVPGVVALGLVRERDDWRYVLPTTVSTTAGLHHLPSVVRSLPAELLHGVQRYHENDPHLRTLELEASGLRSLLVAPLTVQGTPAGLLILGHTQPEAFSGSAAAGVEAVANMTVTVLANATLYQQVQEEARERAAILQSIADGVIVLDEQRRVTLMNEAAAHLLDQPDWAARHPHFDDMVLEPVAAPQELFGGGETSHRRTQQGQIVSMSSAPVVADDGQLLGEVIVLHDISAEVRVDEAKTNFIGTVSHELRTPLTVIRGYLDLLVRGIGGQLTPDQSELVQGARERAQQMTELIQNVITIADIEAGKMSTEPQPQELWGPLEHIVTTMRPAFAAKSIDLRLELPEMLPMVMADRQHLHQILRQLLDNAQRYTHRGSVTISAAAHDDSVQIDISDTGPGIPPEQQEKLFTRFHRVEGNNSAERGSGLGLAITKHLVERQGGLVWVHSEPGRGSTFSFSLPRANGQAIELAPTGDPAAP